MWKEKLIVSFIAGMILFSFIYSVQVRKLETKESITYFPTDPHASFFHTHTSLQYMGEKRKMYEITLRTFSNFDQRAYLRQDTTFLFANGKLIGKVNNWKRNVRKLIEKKIFSYDQNALFQAITFHHSEIHHPNKQITSVQALSGDDLYVVGTESPTLHFHEAKTEEEAYWKEILDEKTEKKIEYNGKLAVKNDPFLSEFYDPIPLTELISRSNKFLSHEPAEKRKRIIGQLMEGIYKHYFLGIKKKDGSIVPPIGSSIPIIWIAKDKSHLYITFETADGELIRLQQNIQS